MELAHDQWGHQGVGRTFGILKLRCFWPGLHKDVKEYIKKCFVCTVTKTPTPTVCTPRRHLLAFRPMELVAMDFLKLDRGKGGFEDVLVVTDAFTKFAQAIPCKNQTAVLVARTLQKHWITHYGAPLRLHSDQGRNFESKLVHELCKLYGIEQSHTTPYHPQGNGQTGRFNRTLCGMIRSVDPSTRKKWPDLLPHLVFLYNATPHSVTGFSPFRLLFGRDPYTPLDQLLTNTSAEWEEEFIKEQAASLQKAHEVAKEKMKRVLQAEKNRHDQKPLSLPFEVGTRVLLQKCAFEGRHKLDDKYYREAYVVTKVNQDGDVYTIRPLLGGPSRTVNRRLLVEDPREASSHPDRDFDIIASAAGNHPEQDPESDEEESDEEESDDPENIPLFPWWLFKEAGEPPTPPELRRSTRQNRGVHRNHTHLPRSVVRS